MTRPDHKRREDQLTNVPVPDPSAMTTEALNAGINSLRDLLEVQITATRKELDAFRLGHEEKHSTVVDAAIAHRKELSDAGQAALKNQLKALRKTHEQARREVRRDTKGKLSEADLRYQQRYDAQTKALEAAFQAQQDATAAALAAAKEAVQTALTSSEKAVQKAEAATDKLIPRAEVESRLSDTDRQMAVAHAGIEVRLGAVNHSLRALDGLSDRLEKNIEATSGLDRVTDAKFVTFRTLIDSQGEKVALALAAANKAVDAAFDSSAAAILKAEAFNEKRFDIIGKQIDEMRDTQAAEAGKASVVDPSTQRALDESRADIRNLMSSMQSVAGRASATPTMETRLNEAMTEIARLREVMAAGAGKSTGMTASWGYLVAAIGVIILVVNFVIALTTK